ncbi:caspase family protein [Lyngbya aestuarii]|uniref:caspase family protein n=1 Tax=Lyngbya aestuarii TaxID=118322 RepID=UPI00403D7D15
MAKVALLIGVGEYGSGLDPLPETLNNVEAMQRVLRNSEIGGFDEIKTLLNPNPPVMRTALETLFANSTTDDLVLLFFSGHVVLDESSKLYLATCITRQTPKAELIKVSSIPASLVDELMNNSSCKQQVVILDCCSSSLLTQASTKNGSNIDININSHLGGRSRSLLSCLRATPSFCEPDEAPISVYTRYLVEGMATGVADQNNNGQISVRELHDYAGDRVQAAAPALKPEFYSSLAEDKILLAKAPTDDLKLKYRQEAKLWVSDSEISATGRYTLNSLASSWGLTVQDSVAIEAEVLQPFREYQKNLQRYEQQLKKAFRQHSPLSLQNREDLNYLQQFLGLTNEDVRSIEERLTQKLKTNAFSEDDFSEQVTSETESELSEKSLTEVTLLPEPRTILTEDSSQLPRDDSTKPPSVSSSSNSSASLEETNQAKEETITEKGLTSEFRQITPAELTNPPPSIAAVRPQNSSTSSNSSSSASFSKKSLLVIGIGGGLAAIALAIGFSNRASLTPPEEYPEIVASPTPSSSPDSASITSPTQTPGENSSSINASPSPQPSPESKICSVYVNGNVRSQPTSAEDNVVTSVKTELPLTGKRTSTGWMQVKLPSYQLAWVHPEVILDQPAIDSCLAEKGITIKVVE